jgi:transposase
MARAYEDDLRRKLLEARARGDAGLKKLALRFGVSHSWAQKVVRQSKLTGQAERVRHRPGPRSRMSEEIAAYMRQQVAQRTDLTLSELQQRLMSEKGVRFSIGRLWTLLRQLDLRLKKSRFTPRNGTAKRTKNSVPSSSQRSAPSRRNG